MNKLRCMEVFMAIVNHGSLSAAAAALDLSPSMISTHLRSLEEHLGVRLLNRTTRQISLTDEGSVYFAHCQQIRNDMLNVESLLAGAGQRPRGRLRIDMASILAQHLVVPLLGKFRQCYPDIQLDFSDSEQIFNTVEGQHDIVIRLGPLADSNMIARRLGHTPLLTVASPHYLKKRPPPQSPDELRQHDCLSYRDTRTGRIQPWIFEHRGQRKTLELPSHLTITHGGIQIEAALRGHGIMQGMRFYLEEHLRSGALCQILPDWTTPAPSIELLYPQGRRDSSKVHAFTDFMLEHYPPDSVIKVTFQL